MIVIASRKLSVFIIMAFFVSLSLRFVVAEAEGKKPSNVSPPKRKPIKTILDYKQELGLTSDQVEKFKDALTGFQKELIALRAKLSSNEIDVRNLINKNADLTVLKQKMMESAAIQVDIRMADVATARKIQAILTPEQLTKWREIQKKIREGS